MTSPSKPRRWSDDVDGIRWLPRMIDKARMASAGALGTYLLGHSPIDRGLLVRFGVTTAEFARIVAGSADDAEVLGALRSRGFDEARVRRWSQRLPSPYQVIIRIIDLDDGYTAPTSFDRMLLAPLRKIERGLMNLVRRISPAP